MGARPAVEASATKLGADLVAASATIVSMNGVTNLHRHLAELLRGPTPPRVVGLFDLGEAEYVRRTVMRTGLGAPGGDLAAIGFFACDPDLEGDLIRAVGNERVLELLAEHGELSRFRSFQQQPAQRERSMEAQLRRFMGTHSGRKARFAPILVGVLAASRIPPSLVSLIATVLDPARLSREYRTQPES